MGRQQASAGPVMYHGRSAGSLLRPAYPPGMSDTDQPMYSYRRDPERTVDDRRQVCVRLCLDVVIHRQCCCIVPYEKLLCFVSAESWLGQVLLHIIIGLVIYIYVLLSPSNIIIFCWSNSWKVNRNTTRCISVILQCKLFSS